VSVKYCVGSEGRGGPGGMTPTGTQHAVSLSNAYESVAVCGQRTLTWPGKRFAPGPEDEECPVCRNVIDGLI
jgi:hypothetical protein